MGKSAYRSGLIEKYVSSITNKTALAGLSFASSSARFWRECISITCDISLCSYTWLHIQKPIKPHFIVPLMQIKRSYTYWVSVWITMRSQIFACSIEHRRESPTFYSTCDLCFALQFDGDAVENLCTTTLVEMFRYNSIWTSRAENKGLFVERISGLEGIWQDAISSLWSCEHCWGYWRVIFIVWLKVMIASRVAARHWKYLQNQNFWSGLLVDKRQEWQAPSKSKTLSGGIYRDCLETFKMFGLTNGKESMGTKICAPVKVIGWEWVKVFWFICLNCFNQ